MDRVEDRTLLAGRPHCKAPDVQIADAQAEATLFRAVALGQPPEPGWIPACEHLSQRRVLLTVRYRVQAEQGGLRRRVDLGRVQPKPSLSRGVGGIDRPGWVILALR